MTPQHLGVSDLMEGGLAGVSRSWFVVTGFVIANSLLAWAFAWAVDGVGVGVPIELAGLGYSLAAFVLTSLLTLALGGKLAALIRAPGELLTRVVFALVAWLIASVGIAVAAIFLVVPGLYLSARWFIAGQLILLGGKGTIEGLKESWRLTEASAWPLVGVSVVLMAPSLILVFSSSDSESVAGLPHAGKVAEWLVTSAIAAFGTAVGVFAWSRLSGETEELERTFA